MPLTVSIRVHMVALPLSGSTLVASFVMRSRHVGVIGAGSAALGTVTTVPRSHWHDALITFAMPLTAAPTRFRAGDDAHTSHFWLSDKIFSYIIGMNFENSTVQSNG